MTKSNDRIPDTGYWQRRAKDILSALEAPSERKERLPRYERVDPTVRMEPVVIKEKNAITDPNSWLNRGLEQLGRNAVDAVFGEESGNALVDYGISNIPGVGAGSILAAGGMPGLVDVTGLGALRNGKKLVKPVKEFILRNAGEEGLQAVDNYLSKFPKVGKLSMADANELLTSGKLGQRFSVQFDTGKMAEIADNGFNENIDKLVAAYGDQLLPSDIEALRGLQGAFSSAIEKGDIADAANISSSYWTAMSSKFGGLHGIMKPGDVTKMYADGEFEKLRRQHAKRMANPDDQYLSTTRVPDAWAAQKDEILDESKRMNEYLGVQMHPVQDFDKIEAAQLRRDAQHAEKAARKAAKQPRPVQEPEPSIVTPEPEPVVEAPQGGPNKWRENGWKSEDHPLSNGLTYDELVGRGASEEDRRASFVLDSLMNEAVGKLYSTGAKWGADGKFYKKGNVPEGVKTVEPSYADYRHKGTNYDAVRLGLARDLERNAATGNMPVSSKVVLEQAYNKRSGNRIPGAKVLRINGMDTYENLFRPRVKDRLAELEEYYNVNFMR